MSQKRSRHMGAKIAKFPVLASTLIDVCIQFAIIEYAVKDIFCLELQKKCAQNVTQKRVHKSLKWYIKIVTQK